MEIISNFESSNIRQIGYDAAQSLLQIWFHNDTTYQYFDVPVNVWEEFKAFDSKGTFLHRHIRGKFRYARV